MPGAPHSSGRCSGKDTPSPNDASTPYRHQGIAKRDRPAPLVLGGMAAHVFRFEASCATRHGGANMADDRSLTASEVLAGEEIARDTICERTLRFH